MNLKKIKVVVHERAWMKYKGDLEVVKRKRNDIL